MKVLKKIICKILPLICLITSVCAGLGCASQGSAHDFYYFQTEVHVQTQTTTLSSKTITQIDGLLSSLESTFAINKTGSFTARFNNSNVGNVNADPTVISVIKACKSLYEFTDGAFNPAVLPLVKLWQFDKYPAINFTPPSKALIQSVLDSGALDFGLVTFDEINKTVYKPHADMQIDLGGIVKGYACERIATILRDNGHADGYVNLGGSSLTLVKMPSLGVAHPRKDGTIISIDTSKDVNLSISTSGDYQRYYEYQDIRYSHVIDVKVGAPANSTVASATITGIDGTLADGLSTALCVCTYSAETDTLTPMINKILSSYPNAAIYAVIIDGQNKLIVSNKTCGEDYTIKDTTFNAVKI